MRSYLRILFFAFGIFLLAQNARAEGADSANFKYEKINGIWTLHSQDDNLQIRTIMRAVTETYDVDVDFDEQPSTPRRDESFNASSLRRAIILLDGKLNENWKFRTQIAFFGGKTTWEENYIQYETPHYSIWLGNNSVTAPMEGASSPSVEALAGRSLVAVAFSQYTKNLGIAYRLNGDNWQWTSGFYGESITKPAERWFARSRFVQTRYSIAPINSEDNIVHFGASLRYRERDDEGRFNIISRPLLFNSGNPYLQSGAIDKSDITLGLENYIEHKNLSFQTELEVLRVHNSFQDYNFYGGFFEVTFNITDERRPYNVRQGTLGIVKPKHSLLNGGYGAWALVARYDFVDLSDGDIGMPYSPEIAARTHGGSEAAYSMGILWQLNDKVSMRASYAYSKFHNTTGFSQIANSYFANPNGNGEANIYDLRIQFGF